MSSRRLKRAVAIAQQHIYIALSTAAAASGESNIRLTVTIEVGHGQRPRVGIPGQTAAEAQNRVFERSNDAGDLSHEKRIWLSPQSGQNIFYETRYQAGFGSCFSEMDGDSCASFLLIKFI